MVVFIIVFFALFAFTLVSYQYIVVVILLFMLSQKDLHKNKMIYNRKSDRWKNEKSSFNKI